MTQRSALLCAELSTAADWLTAQLDTPTTEDLAGCACRALRTVDELRRLAREITSPGSRLSVHVDAVVSVARQLAVLLHRPGLAADEMRECVSLAVETLSLASRLGFSLARHARPCGETCREAVAVIVLWVLRWPAVVALDLWWSYRVPALVPLVVVGVVLSMNPSHVDGLSVRRGMAMSYSPGDWIELVRDVQGGATGQRGRVTSTGFLGGLDIELATGTRLTGVDPSAVRAAPSTSAPGNDGCAVTGLVGLASTLAALVAVGARLRWGL